MPSYETTMFTPSPLGSDSLQLHPDSAVMYGADSAMAPKPEDRMRLKGILNNASSDNGQHQHQYQHQHRNHSFQEHGPTPQPFGSPMDSVQVSTFPVSPVASLSPRTPLPGSPVPVGMASTLATMTPLQGVGQPSMMLGETMPYPYHVPQYYPDNHDHGFKHAGHGRSMNQVEYSAGPAQGHPGQHYYYDYNSNQSPDPSGGSSPTEFPSYPQQRPEGNLMGHSYAFSNSPSADYYGQQYMSTPFGVERHGPYTNNSYSSYGASEPQQPYSPTPPATPLYTTDNHYAAGVPSVYRDQVSDSIHSVSRPKRPSATRSRTMPTISKANKSIERRASSDAVPRRFPCQECDKAFPTKGELASHSRCHLKVPAFLCGVCGRPFKRRTDYVRHVRNVHEEVGRYSCGQCGERFGRLDKLKRHEKQGCDHVNEDDTPR